jgi:hypothetical protein
VNLRCKSSARIDEIAAAIIEDANSPTWVQPTRTEQSRSSFFKAKALNARTSQQEPSLPHHSLGRARMKICDNSNSPLLGNTLPIARVRILLPQ